MLSLRSGARVALGASIVFGVAALSGGCEKKGPAESAGEKVDDAVHDAGHEVDKAADKTADKTKEAGDKASDALKQ